MTVSGVPAGASLSAGTDNGDGTWTLTPAQLTGLTITPPADFSGNIPLTVTATSSLNGETESTSANLSVAVTPVADAPTLAVAAAVGLEDQPVALAISSALVAPAPGEVLSITVSGVPAGASLSAGTDNGDGTWTLTPAQLTGLTITPPADFSGSIPLTVTATSSLNGETDSTSANLTIAVTPVADAPTLAVAAAVGLEDQPVALAISSALVAPAPGEVLSITVSGVPAGASLSAGTKNSDGTWTLTSAQLTGLTITPPENFSGSIPLTVTATSSINGDSAAISAPLAVTVAPVADAPTLAVAAAVGLEDQPVALAISSALVAPAPGEILSITVSGIPAGASLSAGTDNGDGTWTLAPAQLTGLTITPPENFSGSIPLTVTATSSINGDSAAISAPLPVTVAPVADAPTLAVAAAVGLEDQPIALAISSSLTAPAPGEVLSITVSGVPAGASLSAGTDNGDGTWTLTSAQLTGLTITPPTDFSGNIALTITATSSLNGETESTSANLNVAVTPVADAPTLAVAAAVGLEDQPVALAISSALVAPAPGEVLSITVSGVPAGASLSAGTDNGDGTWTLTPAQLTGLTITPPADFSGNIALSITATSSVSGTTAATSANLNVTVTPVADAPTLAVAAAAGLEDQPVALAISSALVAPAPGEVLSITVSGVPAGASLSAGTDNGDGTWTLTPAQLTGLTITPPADFSGSIPLTVTATSSLNGETESTSANLNVAVTPVADAPTLAVAAAVGLEDQPVALAISSALVAPAPGEVLSITVSGVPAGASLSAGTDNGDGTWTLTPAQLTGLTITPPENFSGSIPLTVTATSSINGDSAAISAPLSVTVAPVADAPTLAVAAAVGVEDQPVALAISSALVAPAPGEVLSITVSGVPAGASLSAGTDNGNGTWTLTPAQLTGLTITPPENFSGSIPLTVTATSSINGDSAAISEPLAVTVAPVADAPTLAVAAAVGLEDQPVALAISSALVAPAPGEVLSVTVSGVPAGASLSAGTNNGDGTWTLTSGQLAGLTMTPPANFSGSIGLSITAISSVGGTNAAISTPLAVTIAPVADAPTLAVAAAVGVEDQPVALAISSALVAPAPGEVLSITISGVPAGASLSAGTKNGDGTWTLSSAQLTGLSLSPPADFSGSISLTVTATSSAHGSTAQISAPLAVTIAPVADGVSLAALPMLGTEDHAIPLNVLMHVGDTSETVSLVISGLPAGASLSHGTLRADGAYVLTPAQLAVASLTPPANYSGSFALTVAATAVEGGSSSTTSIAIPVTVSAVADAPTLAVSAATGTAGAATPLAITAALGDTDGSEALSFTISGVPSGAVLNHGTIIATAADGSSTWSLAPGQLAGLTLTAPSGFSGNLAVTAIATESTGGAALASLSLPVTIAGGGGSGVPSGLHLDLGTVVGLEDQGILLNLPLALSTALSASVDAVVISGIPVGATLSAGTSLGNGSYALTPSQLLGLKITPPANSNVDFDLSLSVTAAGVPVSATVHVDIVGVADAPTLNVSAAAGAAGAAIGLNIIGALKDTDGSETLHYVISNVPSGASLSAGVSAGDGSWIVLPNQLAALTITPPIGTSGTVALSVTAVATEADGSVATTVSALPVTVSGTASLPILGPLLGLLLPSIHTPEDTSVNIGTSLLSLNLGGIASVNIGGVPAGATLSGGTYNGATGLWSVNTGILNTLKLTPTANDSTDIHLTVTAKVLGITVSLGTLDVLVDAVADLPTLSVLNVSGVEDQPISLGIVGGLTDLDGSESLSISISGLPVGAKLSAGHLNPTTGAWVLTVSELAGLKVYPPKDFSGQMSLQVKAISTEAEGGSALTLKVLTVDVAPVTDAPSLVLAAATGAEDQAIPLSITAATTDIDGSETLTGVTISGVPTGATLSAGTNLGNGTWSLTQAQLAGLKLTPPPNYSGNLSLSVTATAKDGTAAAASTTATLAVTVTPVADTPTISAANVVGIQGAAIALNIAGAVVDSSEVLTVTVAGLPAGAVLSAGLNNGDGSWTLTQAQLSGLTLKLPGNFTGNLNLTATAHAQEGGTALHASASTGFTVHVDAAVGAPALALADVRTVEDSAVALDIRVAHPLGHESESLSVTISGVPQGATLSAGTHNPDGTWTLTQAQLTGLTLTPTAHSDADFTLGITATATDALGHVGSTSGTLHVDVAAQADTPTLAVHDVSGTAHQPIALDLSAHLVDTDGSEVLSLTLHGVPDGAHLSAGTAIGGGAWQLTSADLNGLTLTSPPEYAGVMHMSLTASSAEAGGGAASASAAFDVHIAADPAATGVAFGGALALPFLGGGDLSQLNVTVNGGLGGDERFSLGGLNLETGTDGRTFVAGTGIELVGGGTDANHATLTFRGDAPADTYETILQSLSLVSGSGGTHNVAVDLWDANGQALVLGHLDVTVQPGDPFGGSLGDTTLFVHDGVEFVDAAAAAVGADAPVEPFASHPGGDDPTITHHS